MSDSQVDPDRYEVLQFDRVGAVLRVTIDHPGSTLNTVDGLLHDEFTRLFADLKRESVVRCVLLTGAGRAFSAGGDFDWFPTLENLARLEHLRRDAKQMIWDLLDVPLPIVAAVNGPAIGLGASLALLCDVIGLAESATIADPHVLVGLVAGDGGAALAPRCRARTREGVPADGRRRVGSRGRVRCVDRTRNRDFSER